MILFKHKFIYKMITWDYPSNRDRLNIFLQLQYRHLSLQVAVCNFVDAKSDTDQIAFNFSIIIKL